jgi:hypothetical protein
LYRLAEVTAALEDAGLACISVSASVTRERFEPATSRTIVVIAEQRAGFVGPGSRA